MYLTPDPRIRRSVHICLRASRCPSAVLSSCYYDKKSVAIPDYPHDTCPMAPVALQPNETNRYCFITIVLNASDISGLQSIAKVPGQVQSTCNCSATGRIAEGNS